MNDQESAAMWKLYALTDQSIAIRSTYSRLKAALPVDVYLGVVKYIDYQTYAFPVLPPPIDSSSEAPTRTSPAWNSLENCVHKRKSFEHEHELRAVISPKGFPMTAGDQVDFDHEPSEPGEWVPVDLDALIAEIRVAPQADPWFEDLVRKVVCRYGLEKTVVRSSLEGDPLF
jgi:hypothetical protein